MSLLEHVRPGLSRRVDFPLLRHKSALLIIDVQKYLTYPEHEYFHRTSLPRAISNIEKLAQQFRSVRDSSSTSGCEVIFVYLQSMTQDGRDISLDYKLSGPILANIPRFGDTDIFSPDCQPDLHTGKGDILLPKTSCSVFQSTNLHYLLRNLGIEQLVVTGQLTDECVESTVRDGADLGYLITVPEDACAAVSMDRHKIGIQGMHGFCRILKSSHVIWEIAESVDSSRAGSLSLEVLIPFLKGRGYTDAALEVASAFSEKAKGVSRRSIILGTNRKQSDTSSKQIDCEDIVTVSSAVADNIRQQNELGNNRITPTSPKSNQLETKSIDHMASTPPITNVATTRVDGRGRDPSIISQPDLALMKDKSIASLSTAQYKQRSSNTTNNKSFTSKVKSLTNDNASVGTALSAPVDLDDYLEQKNRDPPAEKHDTNQLLEL